MADINYLGTIALGKINSWDDAKEATISPISFPGLDSGKTEGVDTLGIIAYFNLVGRFTGDFETIQGQIYDIKNIADGKQTSSRALKSPFINSNIYTGTVKSRRSGFISVNTSQSANELIDSTANFDTWGIQGTDDSAVTFDRVKNLTTGAVANVVSVDSATTLTISADIFTASATYAVTANINVKVLDFRVRWELPGLSYCDYSLSVMQVK